MIFTIYYMAATFIRSWKIGSVYAKVAKQVADKSSVVFYNLPIEVNDIVLTPVSSELCSNQELAVISDCLWYNDRQRGCSVTPLQNINLAAWITFPLGPTFIPFAYNEVNILTLDENNLLHILIETDIEPNYSVFDDDDGLVIEGVGIPVAWKIDTKIAILLRSDINHFVQLLTSTFLQNQFLINDNLPIIRIETVTFDGQAQPFNLLKNHSKKEFLNRSSKSLTLEQWSKHLKGLKSIGVLASQANEFEYNKNKTEGKTGIVKPDLISSKNIEDTLLDKNKLISPDSPRKKEEYKPSTSSPKKQEEFRQSLSSPKKKEDYKPTPLSPKKKEEYKPTLSSAIMIPLPSSKKTSPKLSPLKIDPLISSTFAPSITITTKTSPIKIDLNVASTSSIVDTKGNNVSAGIPPTAIDTIPETIIFAAKPPIPSPATSSNNNNNSVTNQAKEIPTRASRPSLKRTKKNSLITCKPPNILVYSDSAMTRDNVLATLKQIVEQDMYTIYPLTSAQVTSKVWMENTTLLIVCGPVDQNVGKILLDYFLNGGKMLCLCSDLLHIVLPTYRTAEVREHELVQFSYGRWKKVKMMHHIFCYQPSPVKKHFSTEGEEPFVAPQRPILVCPRSVEVKDLRGIPHNIQVEVLGSEETWNTPSLMLANNIKTSGKAVFSQIHLEADPSMYEAEEYCFNVLKQNDKLRVEILTDILSSQLSIVVARLDTSKVKNHYTNAYFLGLHALKTEFLESVKDQMATKNVIKNENITMQFCGKGDQPSLASENMLPILVCHCPDNFSTLDYFENLKSEKIGRLVIYAPVLTSSMNVISNLTLWPGIVVIPRQQTKGTGRTSNQWLSPEGCVMFSIQLHIPLSSTLGQRLSLIQHLIAVAVVSTILSIPEYEELDIRLKWPNDIYANGTTKIGGLVVNSHILSSTAIVNIGCGINLSNSSPTLCINDLVKEYNTRNNKNLPYLTYEKTLALLFTEIERLYNKIQMGDLEILYQLYYKYWLHGDTEVSIVSTTGEDRHAKIIGIDEFGFLLVKVEGCEPESVHPDGNSFDMLRGLICPKTN